MFGFYREFAPLEIQERFRVRYEEAIMQMDAGKHVEAITSLLACIQDIYWELRTALPDSTILWGPEEYLLVEKDGK